MFEHGLSTFFCAVHVLRRITRAAALAIMSRSPGARPVTPSTPVTGSVRRAETAASSNPRTVSLSAIGFSAIGGLLVDEYVLDGDVDPQCGRSPPTSNPPTGSRMPR